VSLLDVDALDAGYGEVKVLSEVDLSVADGEYVTVVGPNGAGKSTVMKAIVGIATCLGGSITYKGSDITGMAPEEVVHEGIGYVPQTNNVFPTLTVEENLRLGAYVLDSVPEERKRAVYDRFPALADRTDEEAGSLSGGQQQMLAMGCALMLDPDVLLLDEPSAGLAPDLVGDMFDRIDAINDAGKTVLMVEQNAKEALRRCDRGYVIANGENRYEDDGEALLNDETVRKQFLGG
jgi:ABC-type branched-subunit amino acid transport system ATPase component